MSRKLAGAIAVASLVIAGSLWIHQRQQSADKKPSIPACEFTLQGCPAPVRPPTRATPPGAGAPPNELVEYSRHVAGSRYGGAWVTRTPSLEYRVGLVNGTAHDLVLLTAAFKRLRLPGQVVSVQYTESMLSRISAVLMTRFEAVNAKTDIPLTVGLRPDLNAVEITAPYFGKSATEQRRFVYQALTDFGGAVRVKSEVYPAKNLPCRGVFCDPPLRAGIFIYAGSTGCTGAFIARGIYDGLLYQMTAGHCDYVWGSTWLTDFVNGTTHSIGKVTRRTYDTRGDVGIVRVVNVIGWRPRAWVVVRGGTSETANSEYPIYGVSNPVVGQRICSTGAASSATRCGVVTRIGVAVSYRGTRTVTVSGLAEASFCSRPGDSGSPVFANHIAYGILSGQLGQCESLFQPIGSAAQQMNVRVARAPS